MNAFRPRFAAPLMLLLLPAIAASAAVAPNIQELLAKTMGPLNAAIQQGDYAGAKKQIEAGADVNQGYAVQGSTAMMLYPLGTAVGSGAPADFVAYLLDKGADPDKSHALFSAVMCKHRHDAPGPGGDCAESVGLVKMLLDRGAKPGTHGYQGLTPLMLAASYGQASVAALLLERGASLNDASQGGLRPLTVAMANKRADVVKLFAARGDAATPEETELAEKLGRFCSLDAAHALGLAKARHILTKDAEAKAHMDDAVLLCYVTNPEYQKAYIGAVREGAKAFVDAQVAKIHEEAARRQAERERQAREEAARHPASAMGAASASVGAAPEAAAPEAGAAGAEAGGGESALASMLPGLLDLAGQIFHVSGLVNRAMPKFLPKAVKNAATQVIVDAAKAKIQSAVGAGAGADDPACACPPGKPYFSGGACFPSRDEACAGVAACLVSTCAAAR